jgi:hypothetical protein
MSEFTSDSAVVFGRKSIPPSALVVLAFVAPVNVKFVNVSDGF